MEAVIAIGIFAGAVLSVAFVAFREATGRRKAEVRAATAEANATSYATQLTDSTNREKEQKQRAEKANATIQKLLAEMATAPAAGSWDRLVSVIEAARAAEGGDGDGVLHLPAGADGGSDWGLLKPGE